MDKITLRTESQDAQAELDGFISAFLPEIAELGRDCVEVMRQRLPYATQLVYDNYAGLVIGFGPTEKSSEAAFSIFMFARGVSLCFLQNGPLLPDPTGILLGSGTVARHVQIRSADQLRSPEIEALMQETILRLKVPFDEADTGRLIIKSISVKQRPRRPS